MPYDPKIHHRKSIRLRGYDYSAPGRYFVTICVQEKACLFGGIVGDQIELNDYGRIVETVWSELPSHFPLVELDQFVVMPNHFHAIVVIVDPRAKRVGAGFPRPDSQPSEPGVGAGFPRPDSNPSEPGVGAGFPRPDSNPSEPGVGAGFPRPDSHPSEPGVGAGFSRPDLETEESNAGMAIPRIVPFSETSGGENPPLRSLGDVIRWFKYESTKRINELRGTAGQRIWQRNYYEHIILSDKSYWRIREYIADNPKNWIEDKLHPNSNWQASNLRGNIE